MSNFPLKVLAVIPARGGSKGIPHKNIVDVAGKPLIAHAIAAALKAADCLTHCIVSTDDKEIAQIAKTHGADVPFLRPDHLATDEATSLNVIQHALENMENMHGIDYDYTLLIQPTNPFVTAQDIEIVVALAAKNPSATSIVSICDNTVNHPKKSQRIEDGVLKPYLEQAQNIARRQDLEPVYKRNGSLYMTRRDMLVAGDLYGDHTVPHIMPQERSLDIDTPLDLKLADYLMKESNAYDH